MYLEQNKDDVARGFQLAEIAMFQISEVQEFPAFNGRRSFLALRGGLRLIALTGSRPEETSLEVVAQELAPFRPGGGICISSGGCIPA